MNRLIVILLMMSVSWHTFAFKPAECEPALKRLLKILVDGNKLNNGTSELPEKETMNTVYSDICYVNLNQKPLKYSWLIHMKRDEVSVIIEQKEIALLKSTFYGPFMSAYKK